MILYELRFYIDNKVSHITHCAQRLKFVYDSLITIYGQPKIMSECSTNISTNEGGNDRKRQKQSSIPASTDCGKCIAYFLS
jgi:hypothetical protein